MERTSSSAGAATMILAPEATRRVLGKPRYVLPRRILLVGQIVVKHFKVPAGNQELILQSFQEQRWCEMLDDPLPPTPGVDAKRRLHDCINRLNRNQKQRLLHFFGDGTGCRIGWNLLELPPDCHQIATTLPLAKRQAGV